ITGIALLFFPASALCACLFDHQDQAAPLFLGGVVERAAQSRSLSKAGCVRWWRKHGRGGPRERREKGREGARRDRSALGSSLDSDPARRRPLADESEARASRAASISRAAGERGIRLGTARRES